MAARRPAVPLALAALSGAALGPHLPAPLLLGLSAAGPLAGLIALRRRGRLAPRAATALLLLGAGALAGAWAAASDARRDRLHPEAPPSPGRPVWLHGALVDGPSAAGPGRVALLVASGDAGERVRVEAPARCVSGAPAPGARVRALGRFAPTAPPSTPGGFDRAAALRREGAAARLIAVEVRTTPSPADAPSGFIAACVRHAGRVIDRGARPRHAAFLRAVLLGERGGVDPAALVAFRRTGTAHLLSISGLHVTVLASLVLLLARGLGLRRLEQALAVTACVALYVTVAGAGVPTVRAAAAGVVGVTLVGRGDAWNRLAVGLLAALAVEPQAALEVGTVLSFGTVAGLLLLEPAVRRALRRDDPLGRARPQAHPAVAGWLQRAARVVPASVAAFVASAPLIAVTLGQLPLASLLLNPPCIALFSVALALSVAGVLVGAVAPAPGAWLVTLADAPTRWIFGLVEGGAALPDAPVVPPAPAIAVLAFGALALGVARHERRAAARALLAASAALLLGLALPRPPRAGGAPLAPPRARPGLAVVTVGRAVVVGSPDGALGFGAPPASLARLAPALDHACGTRRVRWVTTDDQAARLPGGRVVALAPGVFWVGAGGAATLVATADASALPAWLPRADAVVAPLARREVALRLVVESAAPRALVARDCDLPAGVGGLRAPPDRGARLGP